MAWTLDWQDDFDGLAGSAPDATIWARKNARNYETGTLNWYRPENVVLDGASHCVITAQPEAYNGYAYTSGHIETQTGPLQNLKTTPAGNWAVESRCQIPVGKGLWPWCPFFLGADWNYNPPPGRTWPQCGEIDHNEWYGLNRNQIRCNVVRADGSWLARVITLPFNIDEGLHTYRTECQGDEIRCLVDGVLYTTFTRAQIPNWVGTYDQPFILLCAIEVGGNGGTPDSTTPWPARLLIDFIRCYRWEPDAPPPPTGGSMLLTATQCSAKSGNWNVSGMDLYAYDTKPNDRRWVEYTVGGLFDQLIITAKNHGSLPVPPGYVFQLDVLVDGIRQGTLLIPGSQSDQSGSLAVLIPPNNHVVRVVWLNDAYSPGQYDANLRLRTLEFSSGTPPPPPPPPPPADGRAEATAWLKAQGLSDAAVASVLNPV